MSVVGGASYLKLKGSKDNISNSKTTPESKSIFTSVKDALSKDISLICEFKDDTGASTKSYIKNGAVRISTNNESSKNQSGEIIMKDKKMYMWNVKNKQGFVYDVPDSEEGDKEGVTTGESVKSETYLDMLDKYKDSCNVSTVDESYFELPKDIKFQDMTKLLEDLKNQMPQTPQQ